MIMHVHCMDGHAHTTKNKRFIRPPNSDLTPTSLLSDHATVSDRPMTSKMTYVHITDTNDHMQQ